MLLFYKYYQQNVHHENCLEPVHLWANKSVLCLPEELPHKRRNKWFIVSKLGIMFILSFYWTTSTQSPDSLFWIPFIFKWLFDIIDEGSASKICVILNQKQNDQAVIKYSKCRKEHSVHRQVFILSIPRNQEILNKNI